MAPILWDIGSGIGRLVSPPAILLILVALGLWHRTKPWGIRLAWTGIVLMWVFSTPLIAYFLMDLLTVSAVPVELHDIPKEDAMIVVLPAGKARAREYPDAETASPLTVQRVRYGVWLAKASGLPLAIPGGKHDGLFSEAALARSFAENELNQAVTVTEHASLDTRQNALNLVAPLRERNVRTVVLVTDARHMPRASEMFESVGFKVVRAPMGIAAGEKRVRLLAFIPTADALEVSYDVSHEVIGRLWYRARGFASSAR